MKSHSEKQTKASVSLAKAARNARRKRLNIRRMKPAGGVHFGQTIAGEDACCTKKRTIDFKDVPLSEEGKEETRHEKKLKGVVGNIKNDSCLSPSFDPSEYPEISGELPERDVKGKEAAGEEEEGSESSTTTRLSCGSVSVVGRRRVMEDALTVAPGIVAGKYEFFAAYDGHGGTRVAHACRDRLHQLLEEELEGNCRMDLARDWTKVMEACFSKMDEEVVGDNNNNREGWVEEELVRAVGSTAVVVMVGGEELAVANCGDSRALLCRGGVAIPLSNDHKVSQSVGQ